MDDDLIYLLANPNHKKKTSEDISNEKNLKYKYLQECIQKLYPEKNIPDSEIPELYNNIQSVCSKYTIDSIVRETVSNIIFHVSSPQISENAHDI